MFDPESLDEFIYAINTFNGTKSRINNFLKDPIEDIKYIQNNFLGIGENSCYVDLKTIEPIMERYYLLKYKKSPGPTMEGNYVTGEYEPQYNVQYELLKNFAIACGYVTKRVQKLHNSEYWSPTEDEWEEKIIPILNDLNNLENNESFIENWPQTRLELKEYNKDKIEEFKERRKDYENTLAQNQDEPDEENNNDSKESDIDK